MNDRTLHLNRLHADGSERKPRFDPRIKGKPGHKHQQPKPKATVAGHQALIERAIREAAPVQIILVGDEPHSATLVAADAYSVTMAIENGGCRAIFKHAIEAIDFPFAPAKVEA